MDIQLIDDRIYIKEEKISEKLASGIIIPDRQRESLHIGVVKLAGPGRKLTSGEVIPIPVKVGDRIMFEKRTSMSVEVGGTHYRLMGAADVVAILPNDLVEIES